LPPPQTLAFAPTLPPHIKNPGATLGLVQWAVAPEAVRRELTTVIVKLAEATINDVVTTTHPPTRSLKFNLCVWCRWFNKNTTYWRYIQDDSVWNATVVPVCSCQRGLWVCVATQTMAQSCLFIKQHGSSECWHCTEHTCVLLTLHTRRQCMKCHCCSCANMGYINVATFLLSDESTESITAGPRIVAEWNSDWRPTNFLTDFCEGQICALETVFPGTEH